MRCMYWLLGFGACLATGLIGLAAGINLNPETTVKFVPELGASTWAAIGSCVGAVGTVGAVIVALFYNRLEDQQKLELVTDGHLIRLGAGDESFALTFRAVCVGRVPVTVIDVGLGVLGDDQAFYPLSRFASVFDNKKYLVRGEAVEITLNEQAIQGVYNSVSHMRDSLHKLQMVVITGSSRERIMLSHEAVNVLKKKFATAL